MRLRRPLLAICSTVAALLSSSSSWAQVVPDHFENRVPTAPTPGPLAGHKTAADYMLEGWAVVLRTRVAGRFDGCQKFDEVVFEDHSVFECLQDFVRAELSSEVRILRKIETGAQVIFIGDHAFVGRLIIKRGVRLKRTIHMGEELLGVPTRNAEQRRSIGPVDVTNGMIPPIPTNRSLDSGVIRETSGDPPNPPPFTQTLDPVTLNTARKLVEEGLAPPP